MSDAELRAGVEPVEQLLAERQHLVTQLAPLFALYGAGGTAESVRKNEQMRLQGLIRALAVANRKDGDKLPTEAAIEEAARSHQDFIAITAKQTSDRAEFFRLNAALEAIEFRIQRGQALLRMCAAEARLAP